MKKTERDIVMIETKRLRHHPDNPRKDLGDVTELADSIKKNGIMQNLTVIPIECTEEDPEKQWDANKVSPFHDFYVLIGNRRMEACLQAGLEEVPCKIVSNISKKEQVAIMLEENMQRSDLTIIEQAEGFQMMLDLGETVDSISEKTGFSKATVYHRVNIAKLDKEILAEKKDDEGFFQLSMGDLIELEKVKDMDERNRILKETSGGRDMQWRVQQAVRKANRKRNVSEIKLMFAKAGLEAAPKKAEQERWYGDRWKHLQDWDLEDDTLEPVKEIKKKNAMWVIYDDRNAAVVVEVKQKERKLSEAEIKSQERDTKKKELKEKQKKLYGTITNFIKAIFVFKEIKPLKPDLELYKAIVEVMVKVNAQSTESDLTQLYAGKGLWKIEQSEDYEKYVKWRDSLTALDRAIISLQEVKCNDLYTWDGKYSREYAERAIAVVDFFKKYGFSITDDMQQLLDGTDESYVKE
nr:MAG TPA: chromosome partitioning protein [Caudoviricetes sp.]